MQNDHRRLLLPRVSGRARHVLLSILAALAIVASVPDGLQSAATSADEETAMKLATLLRAGRVVISKHQDLINDPDTADKGLSGEQVLEEAVAVYRDMTGEEPGDAEPGSRNARLLQAQMQAIRDVVDANQATINAEGIGFKGFIPAVFARLVNERFAELMGEEARIKVTAPEELVRNRTARPDDWEISVLEGKFATDAWPRGEPFSETVDVNGQEAFRLLVPEYYQASCLACHGEPTGEVDITGYPKEGGKEGDLGAAISVTLFR